MTSIRRLGWTALALFALVGCEPATPPVPSPPVAQPATSPDKAPTEIKPMPVDSGKADEPKKEGASVEKLTDKEIAEIKKLPADEQPIALAQVICPVSKGHLGMEVPIKQVIGDKTFYICCSSCEKDVKTDPAAVLAELAKLKK